ncbi:MAG TPA: alkaline phosphatase family protein [Candidatus Limnocylindrales bacterium]
MRIRVRASRSMAFVALAISVGVGGCAGGNATATAAPTPTPVATTPASMLTPSGSGTSAASSAASSTPSSGLPDFKHVYVIILENREYSSIVGSNAAPYINSLIARYGQATNLYAETHPSEPNYIALTSGGLQGTNSDGAYNLGVPNLFDQIEASGRSWHVYAQGYPGNCFKSFQALPVSDGPGADGDYVRKHNPAISYTSISGNPTRCSHITRLEGFDPTAADFEMIIPNEINDMHSSSVRAGDDFLRVFVREIIDSPAFADSVLFITWDEGSSSDKGGGHIATIVASPGMTPGSRFDGPATHYSMLRTIELAWGMPLLGEAQKASTITLPY